MFIHQKNQKKNPKTPQKHYIWLQNKCNRLRMKWCHIDKIYVHAYMYTNIWSYKIITSLQVYIQFIIQIFEWLDLQQVTRYPYKKIFPVMKLQTPVHTGLRRLTLQTWRTRLCRNTGNTSSPPGIRTVAAGTPKH